MTKTFKVYVEKMGGSDPETYIGKYGEIWFDGDADNGLTIRMSDGVTEGGIPYDITQMSERIATLESGSGSSSQRDPVFFQETPLVPTPEDNGKLFVLFENGTSGINIEENMTGQVSSGWEIDVILSFATSFVITSPINFDLNWPSANVTSSNITVTGPGMFTIRKAYNNIWLIDGAAATVTDTAT